MFCGSIVKKGCFLRNAQTVGHHLGHRYPKPFSCIDAMNQKLAIIRISVELFDAGNEFAKKQGLTFSDWVRSLVARECGVPYQTGRTRFGSKAGASRPREEMVAQAALMREAKKAKAEGKLPTSSVDKERARAERILRRLDKERARTQQLIGLLDKEKKGAGEHGKK